MWGLTSCRPPWRCFSSSFEFSRRDLKSGKKKSLPFWDAASILFLLLIHFFITEQNKQITLDIKTMTGLKPLLFTVLFSECCTFRLYLLNTRFLSLSPSGSCEELISLVWCFSSRQLDGLPIKSRTNAVSVGRAIQYSSAMFQTTAVLSLCSSLSLCLMKNCFIFGKGSPPWPKVSRVVGQC